MLLDLERIRKIFSTEHYYYAGRDIPIRTDYRWYLGDYTDFISRHLTPGMRILDVGCGKGHILIEMCQNFGYALGIDNDPQHIHMALEAKQAGGISNVDFTLLDYPAEASQLEAESFDAVISIRGPVPDTAESIQAAHRLLRLDGLLFCQEIGELHHIEADEVFGEPPVTERPSSASHRYWKLLEENGFDVRLVADNLSKMYFPDIYAWLDYECNLWAWFKVPFPAPDDPRIPRMVERCATPSGEICITGHVSWLAGVKK
jgi:SAM-dependent methyltransferase